jgi:hypothetical protein
MRSLIMGLDGALLARAACAVLGFVAFGCAMDVGGEGGGQQLSAEANLGTSQQALNACPANTTCFDYSAGSVSARVYQCAWSVGSSNFQNHLTAGCFVDTADFALVGGGAEIQGDPVPGGLLTVSMPNGNGWFAASKDHVDVGKHNLRAYAIGLRLSGYTAAQLRGQIHINSATSGSGHSVSAFAGIPAGELLLGGGAETLTTGAGQLLTNSYPASTTVWTASSKDHVTSSTGFVTAYAISIPACPPNLGYCLTSSNSNWWSSTGTGYRSSSIANPAGWVTVGVGAHSSYSGSGRLLTDIVPLMSGQGGVFGSSKDHKVLDSGAVLSFAMALRRQ